MKTAVSPHSRRLIASPTIWMSSQDQLGDSIPFSAQHAVMLRRLQRSRLQNALIRHKAERFVALKALRQSCQLRRQLAHAQAAASSVAGGWSTNPTPPPPLDPSVKALIEKLTEIADILPSAHKGEQTLLGQPRQGVPSGWGEPNDQQHLPRAYAQNAVQGNASRAVTTREPDASQGPSIGDDVSNQLDSDVHHAEDGEEVDMTVRGAQHDASVSLKEEDYMDLAEEDDVLGQQLRELDSNMSTMFQNLEKNVGKDGSKDSELFKNADAQENRSKEEDAEKKREEQDRQKERAALLVQLKGLSDGGLTRRPKWRWIAEGVHDPPPDRVLKGKHLWKAAALLIIVFFVRPKRTLMQRKARSKDRDTQDWNATLTIYFDRCQTWLLKAARVPVGNSVLKNSALNFRLNRRDGKREAFGGTGASGGANATGGFVSALVRKVARGISHESLALTLMRLKVHVKGVLNGLTQEMPPTDIMTFFSYLAADGNYFPDGFFFEEESKMLAFDELGAVRKLTPNTDRPDDFEDTLYALHSSKALEKELAADNHGHHEGFLDAHHLGWLVDAGHSLLEGTKAGMTGHAATAAAARPTDLRAAVLHGREHLPGKFRPLYRHEANNQWFDTSFVEMILTNYLMVRVLIPWILLYPQESGMVPSSGVKQSLLLHNCQVLASTVYLIVRILRPELTVPNADTMQAAMAEETERAAKIAAAAAAAADEEDDDNDNNNDDDEDNDEAQDGNNRDDASRAESGEAKKGGTKTNKLGARRRGSRAAAPVMRPRTVREIMQTKRYVSVSDRQLVPGLLPDAYFLPFAEQMRPWVLQLAAEFDSWMQKVVAVVMGKVESSAMRQERAAPKDQAD